MRFPYHLKPNRISDLKANHISNFKANHIPDRHIKLKSNCIQISKSKSPCMAEGFVGSFSSKKTQSLECQDHFPERQSSSWDKQSLPNAHGPHENESDSPLISLHYLLLKTTHGFVRETNGKHMMPSVFLMSNDHLFY